jgi:hypothetical protein
MESQQMMELLLKEIRAGQEENRINQAKMDADRKTDKEELKTNHAKLLATMEADQEGMKVAMQYKRSELDDTL